MNAALAVVAMALVLILPISALAARRLPVGSVVRLALLWIAIFALAWLAVLAWRTLFVRDDAGEAPFRGDVAVHAPTDPKLT